MKVFLNENKYKLEIFELLRSLIGEGNIEFVEKKDISQDLLTVDISEGLIIEYFINRKRIYSSQLDNIKELTNNYYSINMIIKREIYKFFENILGISNDWGVLTGVKPTKVARRILENNNILETEKFLKEKLLLKQNKIDLLFDTIRTQNKYMNNISTNSYSLYINIPFCPTRCHYCSFATLRMDKHYNLVPDYLNMLIREMELLKPYLQNQNLSTIYIGGGTPTSLNNKELDYLLSYLNENYNIHKKMEFTVEGGREDTLDYNKMRLLKSHNVSRLSLNPQTFNDRTLKLIGRKQNNEELIKRHYEARNLGFDTINMDLILGLPKEEIDDLKYTLSIIEELMPENLTVHTLSVKRGSKIEEKNIDLNNERNLVLSMMENIHKFTDKNNYLPYYMYRQKQILGNMENIGYSLDGKECIYNILMMEDLGSIIGIGMGASSKIIRDEKIKKYRNTMNMKNYMDNIDLIAKEKLGELYD